MSTEETKKLIRIISIKCIDLMRDEINLHMIDEPHSERFNMAMSVGVSILSSTLFPYKLEEEEIDKILSACFCQLKDGLINGGLE